MMNVKFFNFIEERLQVAVQKANSELEKEKIARQEADNRKLEAEARLIEALNAKSKLEEELKELKAGVFERGEIQNPKVELKECIIRKAEKMESNNRNSHSYFLEQQLNEANEKLIIKEANINSLNRKNLILASDLECANGTSRKMAEEIEKLKSDLSYVSGKSNLNMCHFGVQTEETHPEFFRRNIREPGSILELNSTMDSSELNKNFLENQNETHNIADPSLTQLSMSECTSVMTAAGTGLMSTAPPPVMMSAAASTLVQVPMVVPANAFISVPGPYILDAQSSATFLNTMNPPEPLLPPPEPPLKSKAKSSSAMKYSVK